MDSKKLEEYLAKVFRERLGLRDDIPVNVEIEDERYFVEVGIDGPHYAHYVGSDDDCFLFRGGHEKIRIEFPDWMFEGED
jgi:hypothetical protein